MECFYKRNGIANNLPEQFGEAIPYKAIALVVTLVSLFFSSLKFNRRLLFFFEIDQMCFRWI